MGPARILALAVALAIVPRAVLSGEAVACGDPGLSVLAASPDVAAVACAHAEAAKRRLTACGLAQTRPLRIRVVPRIVTPVAAMLGTYDRSRDVIEVTEPGRLAAVEGEGGPYDILPPDVLFGALLGHEMAHALLEQAGAGHDIASVDREYVAAVFELEMLDPDWRAAYLAAAPVSLPPRVGLVNEVIYAFAPRAFAANAWQLFASEADGCARIRQIAAGAFTFADPSD